jgi:hypothetical protein
MEGIYSKSTHSMSRLQFLRSLCADPDVAEELIAYCDRKFNRATVNLEPSCSLPPEPHVAAWRQYVLDAKQIGAFAALQNRLVQLRFPIRVGISQSEAYRAATRRGISSDTLPDATGLRLERPEQLQLLIHDSLAGPIPVLIASGRADFVAILRAIAKRNEPEPIPNSMGAMLISGYNNWDRIRQIKEQWQAERADDDWHETWDREFQNNVVPRKELYQDKFIILSDGPYSGIAAAELGLSEEEWQRLSLTIRLEHECTHYFTRRLFGSAKNHLLDELIADYRGITSATGRFRADWFLRFMGLENYPAYRAGGRLENYRGDPPLSEKAFAILQTLVKLAGENVERFDHEYAERLRTPESQVHALMALTRMTLDDLAADERSSPLKQAFA